MAITPEELRELNLLHAESLLEHIEALRAGAFNRTGQKMMAAEFEELLELVVKTVNASDDSVFDALSELESFLR